MREDLWDGRSRNVLTLGVVPEALGDTRTALAKTADAVLHGLSEEDRRAAQRVLLALVRPGVGWEFTSSRVAVGTLLALGASDRYRRVLGTLKAARLIRVTPAAPADGPEGWTTPRPSSRSPTRPCATGPARRLARSGRDRKASGSRLTAAAEQWKAHGQDKGGLLGGSLLAEALTYSDLNPLEARFVQASQDAADADARRPSASGALDQSPVNSPTNNTSAPNRAKR